MAVFHARFWMFVGTVFIAGCGSSGSEVTVATPVPPHAPEVTISFPEQGALLYPGDAPWRFEGRVSDQDVDDPALLSVTWTLSHGIVEDIEQSAIPGSDGSVGFEVTYLGEDTYTLTLTAEDSTGLSTVAEATFDVRNQPPHVTITSPSAGASVFEWQPLTVSARVIDPEYPDTTGLLVTLSDDQTDDQVTGTTGADGMVSFQYVPEQVGHIQLTVSALDELSARGVATVGISVASCGDADEDGFLTCSGPDTPADCDDQDADIYPGAVERCDGKDDDCDGRVQVEEYDFDGDSFAPCGGDCDDDDPMTYQGASELCDGVDNDCDGAIPVREQDQDGDGHRGCGTSSAAPDCDDQDFAVHPGAEEQCNGRDDDCDGLLPDREVDADGDGWMTCAGDCDDQNCWTYPGAVERLDFADNDCDGAVESSVTTAAAQWLFQGQQSEAQAGYSVASSGDLNGDGVDDLVFGAPRFDVSSSSGTYEGAVFLVLSDPSPWCGSAAIDVQSVALMGTVSSARAGTAVSIGGDINEDGIDDLLVGAPNQSSGSITDAGAVYVVPGRVEWSAGNLADDTLTIVQGSSSGMYLGTALSGPGDIDGDGGVDVAIGGPWLQKRPSPTGMVAILSSRPFSWTSRTSVASLPRFVGSGATGVGVSVAFGYATSMTKTDLFAGGVGDSVTTPGLVYWLPGQEELRMGQQASFDELGAARFDSSITSVRVGWSVASGADLDGDGRDDVAIGVGENSGELDTAAYLIFGARDLPASGNLDAVADVHFLKGDGDSCPCAVGELPDWNGDGVGDLAVGVSLASYNGASSGRIYLFFGRDGRSSWPSSLPLSTADAVIDGANPGDQIGQALAAGDLNGDGLSDLIVGAPLATVITPEGNALARAGKVAVFLGSRLED